ncbi:MAG TPA: hypothetical protein VMN56_02120 [Casimicrobiaceae bacterium]|nr:hypothetical protein [Casimicrobiaceae bacterium]
MSAPKRPPREGVAPAALPVPRVRAMRTEDDTPREAPKPSTAPPAAGAKRRRAKFVF